MVENERMNFTILDNLVNFLESELKNTMKYLETKNSDYSKLVKINY